MGWYSKFYGTAGPGILKDEPKPAGIRLFFSTLLREWKTLIKLNLLFLVFCMPVITIPAALCAMQHITLKLIQDEPVLLVPDFFRAFRRLFKRTTLWGWGYLLLLAAAIFCLTFYGQMKGYHALFLLPFLFVAIGILLMTLAGIYFFPLLIRSDMSGMILIRNAFLMSLTYFPHGFPVLVINVLLVLFCEVFLPLVWPVVFLGLFSVESLIVSFAAWTDICTQLKRDGTAPVCEYEIENEEGI